MSALDIHLIFPPQWSPFQPFLSTPSLKAHLSRQGFRVFQSDWNVDFYEYFISRERYPQALARLQRYVHQLPGEHENYRNHALVSLGILKNYREKHRLAERLRTRECLDDIEGFYRSVTAFKRLLHAFSVAEPVVEVGTSSLSTGSVLSSFESVDRFCEDIDDNPFLAFYERKVAAIAETPRYFGLSVIGTEQILSALTLGRCLKRRFPDSPVLIGGSVFSRLVDRAGAIDHFFGRYFDLVVRYEGEGPLAKILAAADPYSGDIPSLSYLRDGAMVSSPPGLQLTMEEIATPDFSDLELGRYYTPDIVLPLLSTRGCYWDKCAFCYHGMIYGDRYRMRAPERLLEDVQSLHERYGVTHFALNDEAIPPKLFEKLPGVFPKRKFYFTGLYKFEKYFEPRHYQGMYDIGFRSLYIGLESANERVQRHMKKNNTQKVMLSNLTDAHNAGIWNHTFNFFGFPTETRPEAMDTIRFLINHADIIHSEGTGTFSFEHNAPISKNPEAFGVSRVIEKHDNVLELYYDYDVTTGLTQEQATEMVELFRMMKLEANVYQYSGWIPREHLLVLLSRYGRDELRSTLETLEVCGHASARWDQNLSWFAIDDRDLARQRYFVVNTQIGTILETNADAVLVLEFMPGDVSIDALLESYPLFGPALLAQEAPVREKVRVTA